MNVSVNIKNQISIDAEKAEQLSAKLGLNRKLTELLILRGIDSEDAMRKFLYPDKAMFNDPFSMKGMREAVERIEQAVNGKSLFTAIMTPTEYVQRQFLRFIFHAADLRSMCIFLIASVTAMV